MEPRKAPGDPKGATQRDLVPSLLPLGPLRPVLCAMEGAQLVALWEVWPWQGRGDTAGSNQNPTEAEPEGTPEALGQFPPFAG